MAGWSQSHFLQSLGWATLNSLWQMALLWCIYLTINFFIKLSAAQKYRASVFAIFTGFAWFLFSFVYYYQTSTASQLGFNYSEISQSSTLFQVVLTSASVSYLVLLILPSYHLFKNWLFVKKIRTQGLHKASPHYRMFVQKIAAQIGIAKKVVIYISDMVSSPVTVGYLKPIILLPFAALNNLSVQQLEAVLLHELSHIKRYDYLVNLLISCIHTILYFNPFVKLFMKNTEVQRENCCDELVIQYGYDKMGYASALLTLEKVSSQQKALILAATGGRYLLNRIEKITGMPACQSDREKRSGKMKFAHLGGLLGALFCILFFNSVLVINEEKKDRRLFAYENAVNALNFYGEDENELHSASPPTSKVYKNAIVQSKSSVSYIDVIRIEAESLESEIEEGVDENPFTQVALDEADASLTEDDKKHIKSTVDATKKMLNSNWPVVEEAIGDAMTQTEKLIAKKDYLKEVENVDWKNLEQNLKASFHKVDWNNVNTTINSALSGIQLDSLQRSYSMVLTELNKLNKEIETLSHNNIKANPLPDCSLEEIKKAKGEIVNQMNLIKTMKTKKVVRL